MNHRLKIYKIY